MQRVEIATAKAKVGKRSDFIRKEKSKNNLSIKAEVKALKIENEIDKNLLEDFNVLKL